MSTKALKQEQDLEQVERGSWEQRPLLAGDVVQVRGEWPAMERTSPLQTLPFRRTRPQVSLKSTHALLPLCFQSGVAISAKAPSPRPQQPDCPTYPCSVHWALSNIRGPLPEMHRYNSILVTFKQKSSPLCPRPSPLCPPQVWFLPLVYFSQTLHYVNSMKCSHCITNYLYSYLGIPWSNLISLGTGLLNLVLLGLLNAQRNTTAGNQGTITSLTNIPVVSLLPICLPVSIYLPTYVYRSNID